MEDFQAPVPVVWNNDRVLTTAQLSEFYGCSQNRIVANFSMNKKYYIEGVHYFKIVGSDLEDLRKRNPHLQISPMARALYLWTYQGCVRHCKSINTVKAWQMFDKLEKHYFNSFSVASATSSAPVATPAPDLAAMQAQIDELKATVHALKSNVEEMKSTFEAVTYAFEEGLTEMKKHMPPADCAEKLLIIAGMMNDSIERHAILIKAANLFVGKKFV